MQRFLLVAVLLLGFVVAGLVTDSTARGRKAPKASDDRSGAFDYYVISLSWSPTFCETHPDETDQCGEKGYGFVLHGLWPQYQRGGGPQRCASDTRPDSHTIKQALAFMPSRRLIQHEWQAHGACSGLDPKGYFDLADRAFAAVHVPPALSAPIVAPQMDEAQVIQAFVTANSGLHSESIRLHCSSGELAEVRVCVDKNLDPRACGARMQSRCPSGVLQIPLSR
ncbi:MAG: ribonuclease T2 [Dokdonella sp.]